MKNKEIEILDTIWSSAVKERDGFKCMLCGRPQQEGRGKGLNSHHLITRLKYSTRWNIDNGVALCYACHIRKVHVDTIFYAKLFENMGFKIDELIQISRSLYRETYQATLNIMYYQAKELGLSETLNKIEEAKNFVESKKCKKKVKVKKKLKVKL
jgi:hypothetical protein